DLGVIRRQMDYVFDLVEICNSYDKPHPFADFMVSSLIMITRADGCLVRCLNKTTGMLEMLSSFGMGEKWKSKSNVAYENSLAQKAFEQGAPIKIVDLTKEPRYSSLNMAREHNFNSLSVMPIVYKNQMLGSLTLYITPEKNLEIFDNEFIEQYIKLFAALIGNMLLNK
ncbi:MAG: GAF domain-containing protein, partial [Proteobacteria bacterium]|nr:GAF domain-containing protein [Pseudomonadota bacterium]